MADSNTVVCINSIIIFFNMLTTWGGPRPPRPCHSEYAIVTCDVDRCETALGHLEIHQPWGRQSIINTEQTASLSNLLTLCSDFL